MDSVTICDSLLCTKSKVEGQSTPGLYVILLWQAAHAEYSYKEEGIYYTYHFVSLGTKMLDNWMMIELGIIAWLKFGGEPFCLFFSF